MSSGTHTPSSIPPQALAGIRVIELGQLIAGPFAGKTLADFGAEVIKVEPPPTDDGPGGDPLRQWRMLHNGTSVWWQVQSRNKKSVVLDLRTPEGRETVARLIDEADVLIENFKPGTMEKWGLGYEQLSARNPGLIMLRISGYGQTGPYRERPGFAVVAEAMGGMRHLNAEPGRVPVRAGVSLGDTLAALHGAIGILLACCMFWGLQQILVKAIVHEVAPLFQASLRCIGACVLLMLWCRWRGVKLFERDGSLWAGLLAGALFAHKIAFLAPDIFTILLSIQLLLLVIVGGLGSLHGAVFGAIFVALLPQGIAILRDTLPFGIGNTPGLEPASFGLILVLCILFAPHGMYGGWLKIKSYFTAFPLYRRTGFRRQKSYAKSERLR